MIRLAEACNGTTTGGTSGEGVRLHREQQVFYVHTRTRCHRGGCYTLNVMLVGSGLNIRALDQCATIVHGASAVPPDVAAPVTSVFGWSVIA